MRRAAARHGGAVIALSPWSLRPLHDDATRAALRAALAAPRVVFTSPAAARAVLALQPLVAHPGQRWFAVGAGTAAALRRAGIGDVEAPGRMDSEGLLALPGLQRIDGPVGLVTAPGGRGTLAPALRARGGEVLRADVYLREPLAPSPRAIASLRACTGPTVLAVSSAEALQQLLATLPADLVARLRARPLVAASDRLVEVAEAAGFRQCRRAADARPASLVEAAAAIVRDTPR